MRKVTASQILIRNISMIGARIVDVNTATKIVNETASRQRAILKLKDLDQYKLKEVIKL